MNNYRIFSKEIIEDNNFKLRDFFGNELRIGQEVAYLDSMLNHGPNVMLRSGIILGMNLITTMITIRSNASGIHVGRKATNIVGNLNIKSRENFFEGENHNYEQN